MWFITMRQLRHRVIVPLLILLIVIGAALAVSVHGRQSQPYQLARDLPRSPMVYVQFSDLPGLLERWHSSQLKAGYLTSVNFEQLENRHLAIRIVERFTEFSDGLGFSLNSDLIKSVTGQEAAIGLYDIGRLDLVFIAPLTTEQWAASQFWLNKDNFTTVDLSDGTTYYFNEVAADRGRQKQRILFAVARGKFVLATNEQLLLRTLSNINNRSRKDRFSDEPNFQRLTRDISPHFATVWVDQQRLNQDYYFRNYWVMKNLDELARIRAGIFDLELWDDRWIERRDFIINSNRSEQKLMQINKSDRQRIEQLLPIDLPFYQMQAVRDQQQLSQQIRDTLFEPLSRPQTPADAGWDDPKYSYYTGQYTTYFNSDPEYRYFSDDFDALINSKIDAATIDDDQPDYQEIKREAVRNFAGQLAQAFTDTQPQLLATVQSPQALEWPLLADFRRAAIISLTDVQKLDQARLQAAINSLVAGQLLIAGADRAGLAALQWQQRSQGQLVWQELELPMLGWRLVYAIRDSQLIIANSGELLQAMLRNAESQGNKSAISNSTNNSTRAALTDLTVINFTQRQAAFDGIFAQLAAPEIKAYKMSHHQDGADAQRSEEFFTGNIGGLLDLISDVREVEIKRNVQSNRQQQEITIYLKKKD